MTLEEHVASLRAEAVALRLLSREASEKQVAAARAIVGADEKTAFVLAERVKVYSCMARRHIQWAVLLETAVYELENP